MIVWLFGSLVVWLFVFVGLFLLVVGCCVLFVVCCCCSEESMNVCMSTAPWLLIGRASTPKRRPNKDAKHTAKMTKIITPTAGHGSS